MIYWVLAEFCSRCIHLGPLRDGGTVEKRPGSGAYVPDRDRGQRSGVASFHSRCCIILIPSDRLCKLFPDPHACTFTWLSLCQPSARSLTSHFLKSSFSSDNSAGSRRKGFCHCRREQKRFWIRVLRAISHFTCTETDPPPLSWTKWRRMAVPKYQTCNIEIHYLLWENLKFI